MIFQYQFRAEKLTDVLSSQYNVPRFALGNTYHAYVFDKCAEKRVLRPGSSFSFGETANHRFLLQPLKKQRSPSTFRCSGSA
jgi:hypothetical protein